MAITERAKRDLFDGLEQALGPTEAETLMALLPDAPADQLVTIPYFQTEMQASRATLSKEMSDLRTELKGDIYDLRVDMADMRSELRSTMNRWAIGITAGNTIAVVTALIT